MIPTDADFLHENEPRLPQPDADGYYSAIDTMRAMMAQDIVRARRKLGLSQVDLAGRARISLKTLNLVEQGLHALAPGTMVKLDRAIKAAERQAAKGR